VKIYGYFFYGEKRKEIQTNLNMDFCFSKETIALDAWVLRKLKWFLRNLLCGDDLCLRLKYREGADDQGRENQRIKMRSYQTMNATRYAAMMGCNQKLQLIGDVNRISVGKKVR
jgi:hypothetical protein